jgi:hypothetical protein
LFGRDIGLSFLEIEEAGNFCDLVEKKTMSE